MVGKSSNEHNLHFTLDLNKPVSCGGEVREKESTPPVGCRPQRRMQASAAPAPQVGVLLSRAATVQRVWIKVSSVASAQRATKLGVGRRAWFRTEPPPLRVHQVAIKASTYEEWPTIACWWLS